MATVLPSPTQAVATPDGTFSFGAMCTGTDCPNGEAHVVANNVTVPNNVAGLCLRSFAGVAAPYLVDASANWSQWNGTTFVTATAPAGALPCPTSTSTSPLTVVSSAASQPSSGPVGSQTQSFTLNNSSDSAVVMLGWCYDSSCTTSGTTTVTGFKPTSGSGSCSPIPGTATAGSSAFPVAAYYCTGMTAGPVSFTETFSASNVYYPWAYYAEIANANGVEGGNVASGNSANPSATTATLSQPNGELVISLLWANGTPTANQTAMADQWQEYQVSSATTATNTYGINPSGPWTENIVAVKHQ
jgi:hypothetical protein